MNKLYSLIALTCILISGIASAAEDTEKPANFAQAVIEKAISFMPSDQKIKLSAVKTQLIAGLKSDPKTTEPTYFVSKEEGTGPEILAERFRVVRKSASQKSSYTTMAPDLGRLAACVIALCQPYHTDEAAFKEAAHAAFEKELDTAAASLTASFDEFQKIDNPSEFGIKIAKKANAQLKKLSAAETSDASSVRSAVFTLAANSVADCWYTLLTPQGTGPTQDGGTGSLIGNKRSLKFHLPSCSFLPAEKNRVYYKTREEAIADGYVPCKVCKP